MKLHARLVLISLFAILVPVVAVLVTAASIITQNRIRSRDESYERVIEGIRKETVDTEVRYAAGIRRLSADEYLTAKLYVYNKYWNYIDQGTLQTDILVLKGELEKFLLAEDIDTIAVYRTDYDRYVPVLIIGNPATIPDPVYRQMVDPAGSTARVPADLGRAVHVLLPAGLLLREGDRAARLPEELQPQLLRERLPALRRRPGGVPAGAVPLHLPPRHRGRGGHPRGGAGAEQGRFTGSYRHEERKYTYVGTYFDLGEQARGYLLAGGPLTLGLGELWGMFFQLSIVPLVCMLTAALVFFRWGNEILGHIRELLAAADRIGRGDYRVALSRTRRDEFGELFHGFRQMAAARGERRPARREQPPADPLREDGRAGAVLRGDRPRDQQPARHRAQPRAAAADREAQPRRRSGISCGGSRRRSGGCTGCSTTCCTAPPTGSWPCGRSPSPGSTGEVAGLFAPKLRSGQVELLVEPFADELPVVGDRDALKQVLFNVLKNAFQAVRRPGGRIRIRGESADGQCLLAISDNGAGMDAEARRHLFEPFYTRKSGHGTGLGLALSLRIMERHGGTILVDSGPAEGTTVTLRLPRRQADGG